MRQYSLRTLFVSVLLISVALASIVSASERVLWALEIVLLLLPVSAALMAAYADGHRRAFWMGVSVFALWSLYSLPGISWFHQPLEKLFLRAIGPPVARLHSGRIEREAFDHMQKSSRYAAMSIEEMKGKWPVKWDEIVRMKDHNLQFRTVYLGQKCIQLFVALLGGVVVAWLHRLRQRRETSEVPSEVTAGHGSPTHSG